MTLSEPDLTALDACLPEHLRGPSTTIARIAAGLSGAGVYRVEAGGDVFVLKIARDDEPYADWRRKLGVQQSAASAGLAPRVIHVDDARRAVLSAFVVDRSFMTFFSTPATRDTALAQLAHTLKRVHQLPVPDGVPPADPRTFLESTWNGGLAGAALPSFVGEAVRHALASAAPPQTRSQALSHNDVNPTNLAYDGENILLLDWDTAGPNDPLYDLAAIALFLRLDQPHCLLMLSAYEEVPTTTLPARFDYFRKLIAVMCGAILLQLAVQHGHPGAVAGETRESAMSLAECYNRFRSGALSPATPEGQWAFGLAMVRESGA